MKKLYIICEGETEERLVYNVFYDRLSSTYNVIIALTLPTGENQMGGAAKGGFRKTNGYNHALNHIRSSIKLYKNSVVTTFFDLFRFPNDIACYRDAKSVIDPIARATMYEQQIDQDVRKGVGDGFTFIPHVQPCESEAFLFVDPMISAMEMGDSSEDVQYYETSIYEVRKRYQTPEHIDADKGPSKYLEDIFPYYSKNKVGRGGFSWKAAKEIGIDAICEECEHFNAWMRKLESL